MVDYGISDIFNIKGGVRGFDIRGRGVYVWGSLGAHKPRSEGLGLSGLGLRDTEPPEPPCLKRLNVGLRFRV